MANNRARRRTIRARMGKTGENYTEARARLSMMAKVPVLPAPLVATDDWGGHSLQELIEQDWDGDGDMRWDLTAEATQHDNTRRAGFALDAVAQYAEVCKSDEDCLISDLLGDLRHLCDALGVDIEAKIEMSRIHHDAEIRAQL